MAIHKLSFDVAIQSGATVSNILSESNLRHVEAFSVHPPTTLDAQTFSAEVSPVDGASASGSDFRFLTTNGSNITFVADKTVVIVTTPFKGFRISADGATSAARTFVITTHEPR